MVLQVLHDYSDSEAAEAARCDLRRKAACGFPLDDAGFDPSTLVYWRRRLARSDRPHRISGAVRKVITETGVLQGRRRRAVDSTIWSKRCGEPLAPPRFRPPYVHNHCYAAAHSGTS